MNAERLQPLQQLPMSTLRALRGVLTDIDDTLTRDGAIEPAALQALHGLARARVPVVAITGRPAGWCEPFAMAWPVAAIVAENGAVMLRRDGASLRFDFTQGDATRVENLRCLQACARAVLNELPFAKLAQDSAGRLTDIAIDHSEFAHLDAGQIAAVLAVMHGHGLNATVSSIHVNGWIGAHNKWSAARWAVEQAVGIPFLAAEWLYVGDSTNDQLMFERIPRSVAVANIARFIPSLSALPAYVTPSERGAGFAEVVARLLASRSATPTAG